MPPRAPQTLEEQYLGRLSKVEAAIRDLQVAQRMGNTSQRGGTFSILDEAGSARVRMGELGGGVFGFDAYDETGAPVFEVSDEGMKLPYFALDVYDRDSAIAQNDPAFTATRWGIQAELLSHAGLYVWIDGYTEAGVTGEVRLHSVSAGTYTDAHVFSTPDGFELHQFRWLHGSALNTGPHVFYVEARRTAGSGNFYVYQPRCAALVSPALCTTDGLG